MSGHDDMREVRSSSPSLLAGPSRAGAHRPGPSTRASYATLPQSEKPAETVETVDAAPRIRRRLLVLATLSVLLCCGSLASTLAHREPEPSVGTQASHPRRMPAVARLRRRQINVASSAPAIATTPTAAATAAIPAVTATPAADPAVGYDGAIVQPDNGTAFRYNNSWSGFFVTTPFNDSARVANDTPALNQPWRYGVDRIYGVNLGGWLVLEPFITPDLFERYPAAVDEYTLSVAMGANLSTAMEQHYSTFITEFDFAQIVAAGLNWVRLPLPYWAIETYPGEPYLARTSWTYFLKAVGWARKYGLRIELDLHTVPGSQNGWNHSGKYGSINFLNGVNGIFNAQRTLNYIRTLAEFISQPEYINVIPMFMPVNEALLMDIGDQPLREFYLQQYQVIRNVTGVGRGTYVAIHDGFVSRSTWDGFMTGADRQILESHPYLAFNAPDASANYPAINRRACDNFAGPVRDTMQNFGVAVAGEWSLAPNDCGQWVNGVGFGSNFDGTFNGNGGRRYGSCAPFIDPSQFSDDFKDNLRTAALSWMDSMVNTFFWTWTTSTSSETGQPSSPLWNYKVGWLGGWMPRDPRDSIGACGNGATQPTLKSWMTGGTGAGTIAAAQLSSYGRWPPRTLTGYDEDEVSRFRTYTATGSAITMPAVVPTGVSSASAGAVSPVSAGDGWANDADTSPYYVPVAGCTYLDPYSGAGQDAPATRCTGNGAAAVAATPTTPAVVVATRVLTSTTTRPALGA